MENKQLSHSEIKKEEAEKILKFIDDYEKNTIDEQISGLMERMHELPDRWVLFNHGKKNEARKIDIKRNKIETAIKRRKSFKDISHIIKGLLSNQNLENIMVTRPKAISKLADTKTGDESLNKENLKLLEIYEAFLSDDENDYYRFKQKKIQEVFDKIRQTLYYKADKRENNRFDGDASIFVPRIGSYRELFKWINEILQAFRFKEDRNNVDSYEVPKEIDYLKKFDNIAQEIVLLQKNFDSLKKYATAEEIKDFNVGYTSICKFYNKFIKSRTYRKLNEMTNLERLIDAIDYTIKVLLTNKIKLTDANSIYKNTIVMLETKKKEYKNRLVKLGVSSVNDYLAVYVETLDKVDDILDILEERDKKVKEQQEKEEIKRRQEEKEREEIYDRIAARSKANQAVLEKMEIRRVMEDLRPKINAELARKGLVRHHQTGPDSWETDDSEYVSEFVSRMRQELIKLGIDLDGVTIIGPYDDDYSTGFTK